MKSSFTKKPGSLIELDVELSPEEFKKYWDTVFENELANVHLKGFRPGQAPRELASKAVDPEKVFEKAASDAVRFSLNEVAQDNNWTIIDKPKISIDSNDSNDLKFKYIAKIILFPEVDLGDYKKIARKLYKEFNDNRKEIEVSESEVNSALDWVKKSGADLKNFKDDESLKKSVGDGIKMEKQEREKELHRIKVLDEITINAKFEIPQIMIDKACSNDPKNTTSEEQARKNISQYLIIYKIADSEKLNPTPDEVGEQIQIYTNAHGTKFDKKHLYDYIYGVLQSKNVFEFLEKV